MIRPLGHPRVFVLGPTFAYFTSDFVAVFVPCLGLLSLTFRQTFFAVFVPCWGLLSLTFRQTCSQCLYRFGAYFLLLSAKPFRSVCTGFRHMFSYFPSNPLAVFVPFWGLLSRTLCQTSFFRNLCTVLGLLSLTLRQTCLQLFGRFWAFSYFPSNLFAMCVPVLGQLFLTFRQTFSQFSGRF